MSGPGVDPADLLVRARSVLLDALEALTGHLDAVTVIGAQAIYLHTGGIDVALAESTDDSDVAIDPRHLADAPRLESLMKNAGFVPSAKGQPGSWVNADGIPVDLMVLEQLAGSGGRRGARIPPHGKRATRRARGLEASLVDYERIDVTALDPADERVISTNVAGPAALLVAKLHKIAERRTAPHRLNDKDAHDAYRILRAIATADLRARFVALLGDDLSEQVTKDALTYLDELFASGPDGLGATMAGRAEEGVGDPEQVSVAVSILTQDLLDALQPTTD